MPNKQSQKTSIFAILSFIFACFFSIIGLLYLFLPIILYLVFLFLPIGIGNLVLILVFIFLPIIGLILGIIALLEIKKNPNLKGRRLAISGIILIIIFSILVYVTFLIVFH